MEKTFTEANLKYLSNFLGRPMVRSFFKVACGDSRTDYVSKDEMEAYKVVSQYLKVMEGFGENQWWLSDNLSLVGYYQLYAPCMLVSANKFHDGLEKLLNRTVWLSELRNNREALEVEGEEAIKLVS